MMFPHQPRSLFLGFAAIAFLMLASAFVMQYLGGLKPCELCIWQRYPWVVLMAVCAMGLTFPKRVRVWVALLAVVLLVSAALGFYHTGIEHGWIKGATGCSQGANPASMTLEELRQQILSAPVVACDQPMWQWRGITLASLNAVWSLLLAMYIGLYIGRQKL